MCRHMCFCQYLCVMCRLKRPTLTHSPEMKIFTFLKVVFLAGGCLEFSPLIFMAFCYFKRCFLRLGVYYFFKYLSISFLDWQFFYILFLIFL